MKVKVQVERITYEDGVLEVDIEDDEFAEWLRVLPSGFSLAHIAKPDSMLRVTGFIESHRDYPETVRAELNAAEWKPSGVELHLGKAEVVA